MGRPSALRFWMLLGANIAICEAGSPTYIWIEDGHESLNIELIRNGFRRADSLENMFGYDQQRMAQMGDPRLATADSEARMARWE